MHHQLTADITASPKHSHTASRCAARPELPRLRLLVVGAADVERVLADQRHQRRPPLTLRLVLLLERKEQS
jgi:hypothetical protein